MEGGDAQWLALLKDWWEVVLAPGGAAVAWLFMRRDSREDRLERRSDTLIRQQGERIERLEKRLDHCEAEHEQAREDREACERRALACEQRQERLASQLATIEAKLQAARPAPVVTVHPD